MNYIKGFFYGLDPGLGLESPKVVNRNVKNFFTRPGISRVSPCALMQVGLRARAGTQKSGGIVVAVSRNILHPDGGEGGESTAPAPLSFGDQIRAQREEQARLRLEADVRETAGALDASRDVIEGLLLRTRTEFGFVNGLPRVMAADGKTLALAGDGQGLMSVREWTARAVSMAWKDAGLPEVLADGHREAATMTAVALKVERARNPWRRGSWNLTEQMRISQRDPALAARLMDEAGV
jgi:hypothetical protein